MLAIDWGSSTVRAWRLGPDGAVQGEHRLSVPLATTAPAELRAILGRLRAELRADGLPALACGMIGSAQGLIEAPYVPCPADLGALPERLVEVGGLYVVPGLVGDGPSGQPDVIRGEETQLLGVLGGGCEGLVCLPGTHSKWVHATGLRVDRFATSLTGELRAAVLSEGLIASVAVGAAEDLAAFSEGRATAAQPGGLLHHLFAARSRVLQGWMTGAQVASWTSGLLVGHEIVAMEQIFGIDRPVLVVGEPVVAERYASAIGPRATVVDGGAAARQGLLSVARARGWMEDPR